MYTTSRIALFEDLDYYCNNTVFVLNFDALIVQYTFYKWTESILLDPFTQPAHLATFSMHVDFLLSPPFPRLPFHHPQCAHTHLIRKGSILCVQRNGHPAIAAMTVINGAPEAVFQILMSLGSSRSE